MNIKIWSLNYQLFKIHFGKISAQPHTTLCIKFLDREHNEKNNTLPLGKQICFKIVWGCAEILPEQESFVYVQLVLLFARDIFLDNLSDKNNDDVKYSFYEKQKQKHT